MKWLPCSKTEKRKTIQYTQVETQILTAFSHFKYKIMRILFVNKILASYSPGAAVWSRRLDATSDFVMLVPPVPEEASALPWGAMGCPCRFTHPPEIGRQN